MWEIIKCAVQGLSHIGKNIPCQDKVCSLSKNDVTTIALADGAGSAKFSHFGAERVTKFICENFCQNFDVLFENEDGIIVKKSIVNDIREQLSELSKEKDCELGDLASTLLVVTVKDNHFVLMHIGDGIIGYLKEDELKAVQMPKKEGAVNETFFTTSSTALQQMQLVKGSLDKISGFVLMSDGSEASLYDKRKETPAEIIKKLMLMSNTHRSEVIEKMLRISFETTIKQQTTDDCSIVIMYNACNNAKTWIENSTEKLIKIFDLSLSDHDAYKHFRDYVKILKVLSKQDCELEYLYSLFHTNRKEKKEALKKCLAKLQDLYLIAETDENVYSLFIK